MRIKIEQREVRVGFPFPKTFHEVHLTADFSHEERQIVRQRYLMDDVLLERWPVDAKPDDDPGWYALKIRHLFERQPDRFRCRTPGDAKLYTGQLLGVMQDLKTWLEANAEPAAPIVIEI